MCHRPVLEFDEGVDERERFFDGGAVAVAPAQIAEQHPVASRGDQSWYSGTGEEAQDRAFVAKKTRYALQPRCPLGNRHRPMADRFHVRCWTAGPVRSTRPDAQAMSATGPPGRARACGGGGR